MSTTHPCPVARCYARIHKLALMCHVHYARVPPGLRADLEDARERMLASCNPAAAEDYRNLKRAAIEAVELLETHA